MAVVAVVTFYLPTQDAYLVRDQAAKDRTVTRTGMGIWTEIISAGSLREQKEARRKSRSRDQGNAGVPAPRPAEVQGPKNPYGWVPESGAGEQPGRGNARG